MSEAWANFFVAQCGAAAALLGLLFVSVSLNLDRILVIAALPERALAAMVLLLAVLLISSMMLIPGQPDFIIGLEVLAVGVSTCAIGAYVGVYGVKNAAPRHRGKFIFALALLATAILPYLIAGTLLLRSNAAALYWLAAATILSYLKSFLEAWILLIEIKR